MRTFHFHLRVILILLLLTAIILSIFTFFVPQPLSTTGSRPLTVTIARGMDVSSIGHLLQEQGVVPRATFFILAARLSGKEGTLQAGQYAFSSRNSLVAVLTQLTRGMIHAVRVTVPEGLTITETAHRFKQAAAIDSARFLGLAHDAPFLRTLGIDAPNAEGYLFPNTYMVFWEMDPGEIITEMVKAFGAVFTESYRRRAGELGLTVHETVTLSSIIEREVMVPEERPIISAVFQNRLKLGRALESCATVEYALGLHKPRLSEADLQFQSPYNTYLHPGLPPGPICSPGRAAIEAALYPADVDYLYFVAEGNGRHVFSRSLEEHVRAKQRIRREARNREKGNP